MYLKIITCFLFVNINIIYCWFEGIATEYGVNDGKWEIKDLVVGACDIDDIKKTLNKMYNISNYENYIKFLKKEEINNNKFKKKTKYFSSYSKTVALLDYKSNCGKLVEVWNYDKKNKKYKNGDILLVADQCGSCKNKQQLDIPFNTWNYLYEKEIYKIGNNTKEVNQQIKIEDKSEGSFDVKWRFFEKGENIKLTKML